MMDDNLQHAVETIVTMTREISVLNSMIEHYKECIAKQLEKIKDQEDIISSLCRTLQK